MKRERRKFTNAFKTEVVLEVLKENLTVAQPAEKCKLYPEQKSNLKAEFLEKSASVFGVSQVETIEEKENKEMLDEDLNAQISRLKMENERIKSFNRPF